MSLFWPYYGNSVVIPCYYRDNTMLLPRQYRGNTMLLSWLKHVITTIKPCHYHNVTMSLPLESKIFIVVKWKFERAQKSGFLWYFWDFLFSTSETIQSFHRSQTKQFKMSLMIWFRGTPDCFRLKTNTQSYK